MRFSSLKYILIYKNQASKRKEPRGCRSKLKLAVLAGFIKTSENGRTRVNGRTRTKFQLDFSDPKILEPESYQVLPHDSESHNFYCGKSFFHPIQKDFRHAHVRAGLILNEPAFDETLTSFGLSEKYGLDFQVKSTGPKNAEIKAFYFQNRKMTRDVQKNTVPPKFSKILRTNFSSQSKKFFLLRPSNYVKFTFCVIGAKK